MFSDNALFTAENWSIFWNYEEEKKSHTMVRFSKKKSSTAMDKDWSTWCIVFHQHFALLITYNTSKMNKRSNNSRRYITKCSYLNFYWSFFNNSVYFYHTISITLYTWYTTFKYHTKHNSHFVQYFLTLYFPIHL